MSESNYYDYGEGYQRGFDDSTLLYNARLKTLSDKLSELESGQSVKKLEEEVLRLTGENQRVMAQASLNADAIREIRTIVGELE